MKIVIESSSETKIDKLYQQTKDESTSEDKREKALRQMHLNLETSSSTVEAAAVSMEKLAKLVRVIYDTSKPAQPRLAALREYNLLMSNKIKAKK